MAASVEAFLFYFDYFQTLIFFQSVKKPAAIILWKRKRQRAEEIFRVSQVNNGAQT